MEFSTIKKLYKNEMPVPVLAMCIMTSLSDKSSELDRSADGFSIREVKVTSSEFSILIKATGDAYRLQYNPISHRIDIEKGSNNFFYSDKETISRIDIDVAEYLFDMLSHLSKLIPSAFDDVDVVSPDCIPEDVMMEMLDCISDPLFDTDIKFVNTLSVIEACRNNASGKCVFTEKLKGREMQYVYVPHSSFLTLQLEKNGIDVRSASAIAHTWKAAQKGPFDNCVVGPNRRI